MGKDNATARARVDELIAEAEKLSDTELLKGWVAAGAKLHAEKPDEFKQRLAHLLSAFKDKPHLVLELNLDTWKDLGTRLRQRPDATHCCKHHAARPDRSSNELATAERRGRQFMDQHGVRLRVQGAGTGRHRGRLAAIRDELRKQQREGRCRFGWSPSRRTSS